ncbi:MAG: hypothetical protein AB2570_20370, partial [Candidatus Thiodiazotropha endolucinida]
DEAITISTDDDQDWLSEDEEQQQINELPDSDEKPRVVGFHQYVGVRTYKLTEPKGTRSCEKKRKAVDDWRPARVKKLKTVLSAAESKGSEEGQMAAERAKSKLAAIEHVSEVVRKDRLEREAERARPRSPTAADRKDFSSEHEKVLREIENETTLIRWNGKWIRKSLEDNDVVCPNDAAKTELYRSCQYCKYDIDLVAWHEHIQSTFHLLKEKFKRRTAFRCWLGKKYEEPHNWLECMKCKVRCGKMPNELAPFHDPVTYLPSQDMEAVEAIKVSKDGPTAMETYNCAICKCSCYTLDFYKKHMSGRKHARNVAQSKKKKQQKMRLVQPQQ